MVATPSSLAVRIRRDAAAKDAVELRNARRDPLGLGRLDVDEAEQRLRRRFRAGPPDDVLDQRSEGVAARAFPEPPAGGIAAVGAGVSDGRLGDLAILGAGPDDGSVGSVSIRERIFAAVYDPPSARTEEKFGAELKRKLLVNAHGRVLEIGVGTGLSFAHYPPDVELVGVDASAPMLRRAAGPAPPRGPPPPPLGGAAPGPAVRVGAVCPGRRPALPPPPCDPGPS